jgi:hypothetical protein
MGEAEKALDDLIALVRRTNSEKPSREDTLALQKALTIAPDLWRLAGNIAQENISYLLNQSALTVLTRESLKTGIEQMRISLDYANASIIEQGLIEQVLLTWTRLNIWEFSYTQITMTREITASTATFWERRIAAAQSRYLRACETLVKVRKMGVSIQVNVATQGGQQINLLAGKDHDPAEAESKRRPNIKNKNNSLPD